MKTLGRRAAMVPSDKRGERGARVVSPDSVGRDEVFQKHFPSVISTLLTRLLTMTIMVYIWGKS